MAAEQGHPIAQKRLDSLKQTIKDKRQLNSKNSGIIDRVKKTINTKENNTNTNEKCRKNIEFYVKEAERGQIKAQMIVGDIYFYGRGVKQSYEKAIEWYRKAADAGDISALRKIGRLYQDGNGVKKDYEEALKWYRKAAELGDDSSQRYIDNLYDIMGDEKGKINIVMFC